MMKARVLLLTVAALLLLLGCEHKKISEIANDPAQFKNREVLIVGKVVSSFGALGRGVYEVDDGTGRIWVLSASNGVPSADAYVGVKGHVTQGVTFMGRNYATVLRESGRHTEKKVK